MEGLTGRVGLRQDVGAQGRLPSLDHARDRHDRVAGAADTNRGLVLTGLGRAGCVGDEGTVPGGNRVQGEVHDGVGGRRLDLLGDDRGRGTRASHGDAAAGAVDGEGRGVPGGLPGAAGVGLAPAAVHAALEGVVQQGTALGLLVLVLILAAVALAVAIALVRLDLLTGGGGVVLGDLAGGQRRAVDGGLVDVGLDVGVGGLAVDTVERVSADAPVPGVALTGGHGGIEGGEIAVHVEHGAGGRTHGGHDVVPLAVVVALGRGDGGQPARVEHEAERAVVAHVHQAVTAP